VGWTNNFCSRLVGRHNFARCQRSQSLATQQSGSGQINVVWPRPASFRYIVTIGGSKSIDWQLPPNNSFKPNVLRGIVCVLTLR
jgi:hypothetical protein